MNKLNARLTFRLDAELKAILIAEAHEAGVSLGELVRSWLSDQLKLAEALPPMAKHIEDIMRAVQGDLEVIARYREDAEKHRQSSPPDGPRVDLGPDEQTGTDCGGLAARRCRRH